MFVRLPLISLYFQFRFVNTVVNSRLNKKVLWSYIKTLRFEYLKSKYGIISIECSNNFIMQEDISVNTQKLSKMVGGVNNSQEIIKTLSKSYVKECAEMSVALNSCPSKFHEKLYWTAIYKNKASAIAMIASKIIRKAKTNFKRGAEKIFAKICSILGFKHITYHHEGNESIGNNIELMKNILDIKGKYFLVNTTKMSVPPTLLVRKCTSRH